MEPTTRSFVPLREQIKLWGCSEDDVIKLAALGGIYLWVFKEIPHEMEKKWCIVGNQISYFISKLDPKDFFRKSTSIEGSFCNNPNFRLHRSDSIEGNLHIVPETFGPSDYAHTYKTAVVTINRQDLHIKQSDITIFERECPELAGKETKAEKVPSDIKPSRAKRNLRTLNTRKEGLILSGQISEDGNGSASSHSCLDREEISATPLPPAKKSSENKKLPHQSQMSSGACQSDNKSTEPAENKNIGNDSFVPGEQEDNSHSTMHGDEPTGYLRLREIIGDRKAGIPSRIPVSKSTWWAGVKSGRFPAAVKLSERCTAWKLSDIVELQKRLEKKE